MNQHLKTIQDLLQQNKTLSDADKETLIKAIGDADKQWSITDFKLDRTEKVKKTTAILLEETIEELEQKRKAIETQNRELEIESSLEKVRTIAMGMRKRDDMTDICRTMSEQLESLGIHEIRNVQTAIFYKDKGTYVNYEYYRLQDKTCITEVDYTLDHISTEFAAQMLKGVNEIFIRSLTGTEVKDWLSFQKTTNVFIDTHLENAKSLTYYWFSLGPVALGTSTYEPLNEAEINLFKRFRNVFGLAYQRYIDIEQAEAQAREAQIEASLEHMRAAAMGMRTSSEIIHVCEAMYKQLTSLGFTNIRNAQIAVKNNDKQSYMICAYSTTEKIVLQEAPYQSSPIVKDLYEELGKSKDAFYQREFTGKESEDWHKWRSSLTPLTDEREINATSLCFYLYSIGDGHLGISTYNPVTHEQVAIIKRFKNVFELSYQRFTDVVKAEAQAREARIEAALEKVRSRSMGMQKSEELKEVIQVVYEQFIHLNTLIEHTGFIIDYKARDDMHIWLADRHEVPSEVTIPYFDCAHWNSFNEAKEKGLDFFANQLSFEEKNKFYQDLFKLIPGLPEEAKEYYFNCPGVAISTVLLENVGLYIENFSGIPYTDEENATLIRFGKVFQQTYTRFLDLKKAEAQSREAQVELALERVRARTMAMQKSEELAETSSVLFHQLKDLGEPAEQLSIGIINEAENIVEVSATLHGNPLQKVFRHSIDEPILMNKIYKSWKGRQKMLIVEMKGKELQTYNLYRNELIGTDMFTKNQRPDDQRIIHSAFFSKGMLALATNEPRPQESLQLLERFAGVFDLTYTRFLDLKNAEAQAREAKIEAALERTRTQSMIMQHSKELDDTLRVFHEQVLLLGINSAFSFLWLPDEKNDRHIFWAAWEESLPAGQAGKNRARVFKSKAINYPLDRNEPATAQCLVDWKSNEPVYSYHVPPAAVENYFAVWQELMDGVEQLKPEYFSGGLHYVEAFMKYGCFGVMVATDLKEDEKKVLGRFAIEFERTYTRFLDLQKAEAQTREAQIEAALERVRSKTMAMHNSNDVGDTVAALFDEVTRLGIETIRCGIGIMLETKEMEVWTAKHGESGKADLIIGCLDMMMHPLLEGAYNSWKSKNEFYTYELKEEDLVNYFTAINNHPDYPIKYDISSLPPRIIHSEFHFPEGTLFVFSLNPLSAETSKIFKRFAGVFGQTYRRYLDLQKAETQAREATIEAALERVRGKAMAMHNSNDLSSTASIIFTELRKLGINPIRCGVGLLNKESRKGQLYSATSSASGDSLSLVGWVELSGHPVLESIYDTWLKDQEYYPELNGDQLKSYYELLLKGLSVIVPDTQGGQKQYGHFLPFSVGCLYAWSEIPYNDAEIKILKRFATIVDLTFRRYMELQKSEANAKEAVKQSALDRIRADIASMRTTNDLDRITPLIWNELTILGIPFIRCGVFIMDESKKLIHTFLSTPDGKAIAAFHLPYSTPGNIGQVLSHWRDKKNYIDHWDESAFTEFANILVKQGELASAEQYLKTIPRGGFYLHFLPFLQGMLYVGNTIQLGEEETQLIQSVADAFSTAYARYEDFNKLETAKQQVEKTLADLKQAQTQLVQSEKMASLGELTAGIAHEIQNPLNFVNNFSEVSNELLEEMKDELAKGNYKEAINIANDVKQNLDKINHHGKRADGIVKGMLQHSRSSSGQKELTEINVLADEYIRLCYHGLRAKDKSFNASIQTAFDDTIGKINIVPQDIGRVLLNLLTNAFYAVNEKSKDHKKGYVPTVSLATKKEADNIVISINDNGNGIPLKVLDKIFQPFFTTKPTGQGTGLGLSLSYDIVKAHGGELRVATKEGEGACFIICLPLKENHYIP